MLVWLHKVYAFVTGGNAKTAPKELIADQLTEPRPLPMGRQEFEEWSDRIISGALVTAEASSQKYVLANMILHLGPTESHKPDAFFIHSLRKFAANQVADTIRRELFDAGKAKVDDSPKMKVVGGDKDS